MELRSFFKKFRSSSRLEKMLGVEVGVDALRAASISLSKSGKPVLLQHYQEEIDKTSLKSTLLRFIKDSGCTQCALTLPQLNYQLMLVDSPSVPDNELPSAMKWKLGELTNQPPEEVVVDAFRLPKDAYRGRMDMAYSALAQKSFVRELVEITEESTAQLQMISIIETSLASLFKRLPAFDGVGIAIIRLDTNGGTLCLMESGRLYLCRTLEGHFSSAEIETGFLNMVENVDRLSLDIQRSMDYYESQLGKPGIEMGFVFADDENGLALSDMLNERLPVALIPFQTHELFEQSEVDCDAQFGVAIGIGLDALGSQNETED